EVAFHGLLNLTQDESLARKGLKLEGVHDDFRLTAMEWIANHRPDEARELCLDYLAHPPTEPARQRAVSILGRVKDKPGERRAFEAIAAVL
ncbi:hypothetical protein ACSLVQ_28090, partial [Klebsiella pneumoniae]|uniref:hypothetical protein n=1 Tax=Klebsiella pneumoniae TaxID=573 RepID=UPI003EE139FF